MFTLFHLLWALAVLVGLALGAVWGAGSHGLPGAILGGIAGLAVGAVAGLLPLALTAAYLVTSVPREPEEPDERGGNPDG